MYQKIKYFVTTNKNNKSELPAAFEIAVISFSKGFNCSSHGFKLVPDLIDNIRDWQALHKSWERLACFSEIAFSII